MRITRFIPNIIRTPIESWSGAWLDSKISSATGLVPISKFEEADVFIVGYPKSGHTWFQNLVAGVVYGIDTQFAPDTLIQELVPDVHWKNYYRRFHSPMFFKSHCLPRPGYRRLVYLLRDGRDVMVSFYHHNRALNGEKVDFMKMVKEGDESFGKWHQHVQAWLSNPFQADMLVVRYEDLRQRAVEEMQRFCAFAGLERDGSTIKTAVDSASFSKMRRREVHYGWDNKHWPKDKPFVRRGEVGSYQNEMPQAVLDAFLSDARETLSKYGYTN